MTRDVASVAPLDTILFAAQLMEELNVGVIPVCEQQRLIGVITDRDITVRATAAGWMPAETAVSDAMSSDVQSCSENQNIEEVLSRMAQAQVRRMPVVDDDEHLVGIVSLGDLATRSVTETGSTLRKISASAQRDSASAF